MPDRASRRVGRPRAFDPEAVLGCATDLFWRHGYAQVSVPDLSTATGLSTSSIYNAFGSKRDLYLAALDSYLALVRELMLAPMASGTLGTEDVEAFLTRLAAAVSSAEGPRGCLVTKAIAEFSSADPDVTARTTHYLHDLRAALTAALRRAADRGQLPAAAVPARADALAGIVIAFNLLAGADAPAGETAAMLAAARALLRPESTAAGRAGAGG